MTTLKLIAETLKEINLWSIAFRILMATAMGACIGMDRGRHGRAAGTRTHILVCLGSAITTLLGFYTASCLHFANDPLRMGAQVVSGIGFLGVGTIMIRSHSQVIGLTTAAGLWTTACIGLAIGAGFYSVAILSFFAVILTITLLSRLERRMRGKEIGAYYIELASIHLAKEFYNQLSPQLAGAELVPAKSGLPNHVGMELTVEHPGSHQELLDALQENSEIVIAIPRHS